MDANIFTIKREFEKELLDMICRKVKHQDCCHDIMQEVYLKILANQSRIEKADNMSAYLIRLTNNTITDHYRKEAKMPMLQEPDSLLDTETSEVPQDNPSLADCCLRPFIESLPPIYRDALVLVELEGLKLKEFAVKAEISLTNAKTRVQRAREKLKDAILACCNYQFDSYGNLVSCNGYSTVEKKNKNLH
jgi:RNA polymerase sigma-70 factor (ECF subfamily)